MTNRDIIKKGVEAFRRRVHDGGNLALCEQMSDTLEQSLNFHEQLEGGYHTHHLEESDSHGWAVSDRNGIVRSGASRLVESNKYGSAEDDARRTAAEVGSGMQRGVFSAVMVYPFEGHSERTKEDRPMYGEPHDSVRFEKKIQVLLKSSCLVNMPRFFRKNVKAAVK